MGTSDVNRSRSSRGLRLSFAAVLALAAFAVSLSVAQTVPKGTAKSPPKTQEGTVPSKKTPFTGWKLVDRLISEQKFEEALKEVEKIRSAAQKAGDQDEWTRALVKEVQLQTGLHGYETSVRFLKEQTWPEGILQKCVFELFYARSLVTYYNAYSWEINQREKVESKAEVDLKAWTRDQLFAEAEKAYVVVFKQRAALGREPVNRLAEYLDSNTYPQGIRGTLRDDDLLSLRGAPRRLLLLEARGV